MTDSTTACVRCESPLEREDLRCPICCAAAPHTAMEDLEHTAVEVLRCNGCGAAVSYDVGRQAPACAFCGSVMRGEILSDPLEQTRFFLPFTVQRTEAETAYRRWLDGLGWFRPSDLGNASTMEKITPLWWVGWVFDAEATVTWTADSDFGARRADWAPHAGQHEIVFDDVTVSASRGLDAEETDRLMGSYDLETATEIPTRDEQGATVEQFDLPRSSARGRVAAFIQRKVRQKLEGGIIPGTRFRNVHSGVVLRKLVTRRFAFPSYVIAYRYRGSLYRVVLSGQDAACIIGTAPYSIFKILALVVGGLLAISSIVSLLAAM